MSRHKSGMVGESVLISREYRDINKVCFSLIHGGIYDIDK